MIRKLLILLLFPVLAQAHPGIGIVIDSKGNIYYSDLQRVWKLSNGTRTVVIPNVHTHELYIDQHDNLFGSDEEFDSSRDRFYHYLWVYHPTGKLDTLIALKEAYVEQDFSLSRDKVGNEYYTKRFLRIPDTAHLFRREFNGRERVLATGSFGGVAWLHPQLNGSLLYANQNAVYRIDSAGRTKLLKEGIGNQVPSFHF